MTTPQSQLPSPEDYAIAIEKLDVIWEKCVPRSARPLHKDLKQDVTRILERSLRFATSRTTQLTAATALTTGVLDVKIAEAGGDAGELGDMMEESALVVIMRILRTLTPEQVHQVKILLMLRDLSDDGRRELFFELEESHHIECGAEVPPGVEHECLLGDDDSDDAINGTPADALSITAKHPEGTP